MSASPESNTRHDTTGVTFAFLRDLPSFMTAELGRGKETYSNEGLRGNKGLTTEQLVFGRKSRNATGLGPATWCCIADVTAEHRCSFVEWCKRERRTASPVDGAPYFSPATHYLSHAWHASFPQLMRALESYGRTATAAGREGGGGGGEGGGIAWYIDVFCVNQHDAARATVDQQRDRTGRRLQKPNEAIEPTMSACGRTVLLLEPWDKPMVLTRAWCLFELLTTLKLGVDLDVALSPEMSAEDVDAILTSGGSFFSGVQGAMNNARATMEEDKRDIFALIVATDGSASDCFDELSAAVTEAMGRWKKLVGEKLVKSSSTSSTQEEATNHRVTGARAPTALSWSTEDFHLHPVTAQLLPQSFPRARNNNNPSSSPPRGGVSNHRPEEDVDRTLHPAADDRGAALDDELERASTLNHPRQGDVDGGGDGDGEPNQTDVVVSESARCSVNCCPEIVTDRYNQLFPICATHRKAQSITVNDKILGGNAEMRWCGYCKRAHFLTEFKFRGDGRPQSTCRESKKRLERNKRKRHSRDDNSSASLNEPSNSDDKSGSLEEQLSTMLGDVISTDPALHADTGIGKGGEGVPEGDEDAPDNQEHFPTFTSAFRSEDAFANWRVEHVESEHASVTMDAVQAVSVAADAHPAAAFASDLDEDTRALIQEVLLQQPPGPHPSSATPYTPAWNILPGSTVLVVTGPREYPRAAAAAAEDDDSDSPSSSSSSRPRSDLDGIADGVNRRGGVWDCEEVQVRKGDEYVTVHAASGVTSDKMSCSLWPPDARCPRWCVGGEALRVDVGKENTALYVFGQGFRYATVTSGLHTITLPYDDALKPDGEVVPGLVYVQVGGPQSEARPVLVVDSRAMSDDLQTLHDDCCESVPSSESSSQSREERRDEMMSSFGCMLLDFGWMMEASHRLGRRGYFKRQKSEEREAQLKILSRATASLNLSELSAVADLVDGFLRSAYGGAREDVEKTAADADADADANRVDFADDDEEEEQQLTLEVSPFFGWSRSRPAVEALYMQGQMELATCHMPYIFFLLYSTLFSAFSAYDDEDDPFPGNPYSGTLVLFALYTYIVFYWYYDFGMLKRWFPYHTFAISLVQQFLGPGVPLGSNIKHDTAKVLGAFLCMRCMLQTFRHSLIYAVVYVMHAGVTVWRRGWNVPMFAVHAVMVFSTLTIMYYHDKQSRRLFALKFIAKKYD